MQIQIQTSTRGALELEVKPWDAVAALRQRLAPLVGIVAEHQRLTFGGRYLEDSRVLLEYGIRPGREGSIIIKLLPEIGEDVMNITGIYVPRTPCVALGRGQFIRKQSFQSSEGSTCDPSDGESDIDDTESLAVSPDASTSDLGLLPPLQSPLSSSCASCALHGSSVELRKGQPDLDALVAANSAHVEYLLNRRQRLEAAGYGVKALCK